MKYTVSDIRPGFKTLGLNSPSIQMLNEITGKLPAFAKDVETGEKDSDKFPIVIFEQTGRQVSLIYFVYEQIDEIEKK